MKPSERRAMMAERERRETEREQSPKVEPERELRQDAGGKKEGFFAKHARLIAFIVTALVVFTVFSPFAVDMFIEWQSNRNVVNNKKDITLEQVYVVADNYGSVTWQTFNDFNYTNRSHDDGKYQKREYPIKDTGFVLVVGGVAGRNVPEYIYIQSYAHAAYADLAKDNVKQFVNKYTQEEN